MTNNKKLSDWMEKHHLRNGFLAEALGKTDVWASRLLNGHITVTRLNDAVKIEEITEGEVTIKGWAE